MRDDVVLITGAAGEIGHGLIERLSDLEGTRIVTLDLNGLDEGVGPRVHRAYTGSILDQTLLDQVLAESKVTTIFHLAALLSTRSEFTPTAAHQVNVEGTLRMLEFAHAEATSHGEEVTFFYPSSIAAYGMPDLATKERAGAVGEDEYNIPTTMYGCNKLACEQLGRYYARHYKQLDAVDHAGLVDFRSLRFPGLISAVTAPSGGTSDYAPEMIHAAARGEPYQCFVRPDTRIPFLSMPDAVEAILQLTYAPADGLSRQVYNVAAFNPSAAEIRERVLAEFTDAEIGYEEGSKRQQIVDSWPAAMDDAAARADWGFAPSMGLEEAFGEYLFPTIRERYRG